MIPRALAILLLLGLVAYIGVTSTARNDGNFTYALDDTYIHLAVAEHLAESGNWGINPDRFSPCTSSLVWPVLLGLLGAAAPWGTWIPLALNLVIAVFVLWFVDDWMRRRSVGAVVRMGALVGFVFVVPLGVLTILGLEHVAQIALSLLLLRWAVPRFEPPGPAGRRVLAGIVLAAALVATRAEGVFLVVPVAWFLRRAGRRSEAAAVLLAAAVPLVLFGSVSLSHGGRFIPTPIWMKGRFASELLPLLQSSGGDPTLWPQFLFDFLVTGPLRSLAAVGVLGWLFVAGLAQLVWTRARGIELVAVTIVLVTTWLHLAFARTGWLGRYEAWLIAMFVIVFAPPAQRMFDRARAGRWGWRIAGPVLAVVFIAVPVRARVASTLFQANRGSTNVYEQQVQMARFLAESRAGETVALNDIGAVAYLADVWIVDLWGLSDADVAERRLAGTLDQIEIEWMTRIRGAEVAAVHEAALEESGGAPPQWTRVAEWRIHRNAVCGSSRVSWYATSEGAVPRLRSQLREWTPRLPATVDVTWR